MYIRDKTYVWYEAKLWKVDERTEARIKNGVLQVGVLNGLEVFYVRADTLQLINEAYHKLGHYAVGTLLEVAEKIGKTEVRKILRDYGLIK